MEGREGKKGREGEDQARFFLWMKKRVIFHEIVLENKNTLSAQDPLSTVQSPIPPKNKQTLREVKKKHLDGFNPQWGGGFRAESTFHIFFLLLM